MSRLFKQFCGFLDISAFKQHSTVKIIRFEKSWVFFDCPIKCSRRLRIPSLNGESLTDGNMGFRCISIEFQCTLARALCLFQIPRIASPPKEIDMNVGQARPGRRKLRIDFDRPLEHLSRELHALTRPFVIKLTSAKISFVRLDVGRGGLQEAEFFSFGERET